MAAAGVPLRCIARVVGSSDGVYIAGDSLELVRPGQSDGEKFKFSRIFEPYATDKEVIEEELLQPRVDVTGRRHEALAEKLAAGENVTIVVTGHHRSGHMALAELAATKLVDEVFDLMVKKKGAAGGKLLDHDMELNARSACAVIGSADRMTDLLKPGSTELRIVRDSSQIGGVHLSELRSQPIRQRDDFVKLFRGARSRLTQQHKPPAPSSVLWLELKQTLRRPAQPGQEAVSEEVISQLIVADIEVANLGDGLAAALRAVISTPPKQPPPHAGAALLLAEAFGGNANALLLGCVLPSDIEESASTLSLLAHGLAFRNFPLKNDTNALGLLHRHYFHTQTLHEQLVIAEGKLHRGVEQLEAGQQQVPTALLGATERLQALVDSMQQDAAGSSNERQKLMEEVMRLKTQLNTATGESIKLKKEAREVRAEKIRLERQLLDSQLSSTDMTVKEQQKVLHLEQQAIAAADVLQQQQQHAEKLEAKNIELDAQLSKLETKVNATSNQNMQLNSELRGLQAEAAELREKEDELNMQLIATENGRNSARAEVEDLTQKLEARTAEKDRLLEKAETARAELLEARAEADSQREQAASARLALERSQLEADQDTLALQRQAASSAEEQLERIRSLQAELSVKREEQEQQKTAHEYALARAQSDRDRHDQMRGEINMQLDDFKRQNEALVSRHESIWQQLYDTGRRAGLINPTPAAVQEGTGEEGEEGAAEGEEGAEGDDKKKDGSKEGSPSAKSSKSKTDAEKAPSEAPDYTAEVPPADPDAPPPEGSRPASVPFRPGAAGTGADAEQVKKLSEVLLKYETQLTSTQEANRGLVEAYWRVRNLAEEAGRLGQPLSLPSHEELNLSALVLPGAHGRRSVPSELEKALQKEKEAIEKALEVERNELLVVQQTLQIQMTEKRKGAAILEKELQRVREQRDAALASASKLQVRVEELEAAVRWRRIRSWSSGEADADGAH